MEEFEVAILAATAIGGLIAYFIRLEIKIEKNNADLTWIKKLVDRRQKPRE